MSEIKGDLMSQESMDDAKQFMGDDENGLLVPFSLRSLFHVNLLKVGIGSYDCHGHQEQDTSQAFVSPFRDVASTFPLAGFVGDQLMRCGEGTAAPLRQEVEDGGRAETDDRVKDRHGTQDLVLETLEKAFGRLFPFILQAVQDMDLGARDRFEVGRDEADRVSFCFDQELRRECGPVTPAVPARIWRRACGEA
jgi:hypothetical protein